MATGEETVAKENDGGISTNKAGPSIQKVPHFRFLVEKSMMGCSVMFISSS